MSNPHPVEYEINVCNDGDCEGSKKSPLILFSGHNISSVANSGKLNVAPSNDAPVYCGLVVLPFHVPILLPRTLLQCA